jgi:UDP-N-acetylglucosamine--N-acetylmuramyl-(pentapeptide) pyrophosphoryl-undecaprenol N-acetylglucosamine transferase
VIRTTKNAGKTIVLTGGGTAGHVLPHLALLPHLKATFNKIYYIGSTNLAERKIIEDAGVPFYPLKCVKFRRSFSPKNIVKNAMIPFGFLKSKKQATKILNQLTPDIVFSKGGFVALPVVLAAKARRIPVVAHESDATLGLANRLSVGACTKICTTFEIEGDKFVHAGSLIRQKIYNGNAEIVARRHDMPLAKTDQNLLVLGGSLGATKVNEAVRSALTDLSKQYNIIHVCGRGKTADVSAPGYVQLEYIQDIENYIAWADVVVSRAGSNTLCELMVCGKPTLFIPLSTGRGDQIDNVKIVQKYNAGGVLLESALNNASLVRGLRETWDNRETYAKNAYKVTKDGTKGVFDTIFSVVCDADYTK